MLREPNLSLEQAIRLGQSTEQHITETVYKVTGNEITLLVAKTSLMTTRWKSILAMSMQSSSSDCDSQ